ncbi:3'-5' exonuclease [Patescibacteria group bacterium]|nr:MAG: 3'-5' exonuclease [Patescibacteria group bacterium]
MKYINQPLAFIDIEGFVTDDKRKRVIELGVVRVENNRVVKEYKQLVDPGVAVPPIITNITGITDRDLESAPTFRQVGDELRELLAGALFVAHNASFDYSFINGEYSQIGEEFDAPRVCTARLSKALYPQYSRHNLDVVVERHDIQVQNRHRAYDDALALWEFYKICLRDFDLITLEGAVAKQLRTQNIMA